MKISSICKAALVVTLGASVLGSAVPAFATANELTSQGSVTVIGGSAGGSEQGTIDPENPGEVLPNPDPESPGENTNSDTGSLVIEKTTNLDFGTIKTSANAITSYAKPMSFANGEKMRGSYVQWADVRSGGTYGYTITAQLNQQFTSKNKNVLTGATIDFSNGTVSAQEDNTNAAPSNIAGGFQLTEAANDAKVVVNASEKLKEGKGRYIMAFGQSSATSGTEQGTEANSVQLTIPASTASNMVAEDYTATIVWKIQAVPTVKPEVV